MQTLVEEEKTYSLHFVRVDSICLSVYPSTCRCGYPAVIRPSIPPSIRTSDRPSGVVKSPYISVLLNGFAHHHPLMLSTFYQKAFKLTKPSALK